MSDNPLKRQYRLIFGKMFDDLAAAPDWGRLPKTQKVKRLASAYHKKWGLPHQPVTLPSHLVFEDAIDALEEPDQTAPTSDTAPDRRLKQLGSQ